MTKKIDDLSPVEFENMTYDLLQCVGLINLVWRTPGQDGGRDIEGLHSIRDLSGYVSIERWYVECKRYSSAIDWPTVWQKVSYAHNAGADYLLVVTNSNPSPNCESQITAWNNSEKSPKIRFWRGYEISGLLKLHKKVAVKYEMEFLGEAKGSFVSVSEVMRGLVLSAYAFSEINDFNNPALEVAAAIAELIAVRMRNLDEYGRMAFSRVNSEGSFYDWIDCDDEIDFLDEFGFRAIVALFRYTTRSGRVRVKKDNDAILLIPLSSKLSVTSAATEAISITSFWTAYEASISVDGSSIVLLERNV